MLAQLPAPIKMIARQVGDLRVHTFISSYESIANATHIIESTNALVLVDAQFLVPYAKAFRAYAESLRKPIDRLYLSHRHPDHWFGLAPAFSDIPIYALRETVQFIAEHGDASRKDHWKLGDLAPESIVVPENVVEPGEQIIDGVRYIFDKVTETEIDFCLTIGLPELRVHIVQDLLYSCTHLYLTKFLGHWIEVLEGMLLSDYDLFMPGHGVPADKNEVARNIEYLSAAMQAISGEGLTGDAFKNYMLQRYPARQCPGIFDIYLPRLFDNASDY